MSRPLVQQKAKALSETLLLFGVAASVFFSLPRAFAQLPPLGGGGLLVAVDITSPKAGDRVVGGVPVAASVSGLGAGSVVGVQFQVDGVNVGAEDTTPPFQTSWNASAASDGWRTLTAVARDSSGARSTSAPVAVRVSNAAPPRLPVRRSEDDDSAVIYSLGWTQRNPDDWLAWSGGGAMESMVPGSRATFAFTGPSVTWVGYRGVDAGIARVLVDGNFVADVDLFARRDVNSAYVFAVNGLTNASHTLTIEVTGQKHPESQIGNIVVDAFDVPGLPVSHLQDQDPAITWTGAWGAADTSKPWSDGTATATTAAGARATLTFNGTEIRWRGYRGPETGIVRVFLDGSLAGDIDTYSAHPQIQDVIFAAANLAYGVEHTLTIEVTGSKNAASSGTLVVVDAFDVTTLGERYQETEWAVTHSGSWTLRNQNKVWSEGTASSSGTAGARATFKFSGTGVSWIGARAARTGIANVFLDGAFLTSIDTYRPTGEGYQNTVFTADGLAPGIHTLTIEVTGLKNPAATNNYIVVDAFDVRR